MYTHVPGQQIVSAITHLRRLYRETRPGNDAELRVHEKREAVAKNLVDNIAHTSAHPTLHTVLEVADIFSLTLDGAHRLFGYNLDRLRYYDALLNNAATHIVEQLLKPLIDATLFQTAARERRRCLGSPS